MNDIQLYVKEPTDVNYTRLDLFKDETISLTQTIQDVKDPGKVFTNFSKTFSLPASKTNNKFFKHYENFIQSSEYSFDARKKKEAKIELNSLPFQKGKIRLEGVDLKNGRPDTYRITFFGDLDLKEVLGDTKLQDLDFLDNFDLTYTSSDVKAALTSISGSGDVTVGSETFTTPTLVSLIGNSQRAFFLNVTSPVTSPSYYDATKEEVNISGGNLSTSNSSQYSGYYWKDLVYSIRLYVIIKAIEDQFDKITFSTDFFNTTNVGFYNLYMLCQRNAGKILEGLGSSYTPNQQTGKTYLNAYNYHPNNLVLGERIFAIYNLNSYQNFQFIIQVNYTTSSGNIYVDLRNTSTNQVVTTFTYAVGQSGGTRSFSLGNGTYKLIFRADNNETIYTFSIDLYGNFGNYDTTSIATGDVDSNFNIPTQGFSINKNIPDIKIIDFLSGLFKMFNLTAYKEDGKIYVKTLDSYYTGGTVRDITKYVDSTSKTVDKALPYREIKLKYEDTNNILAKNHLEQFQNAWGEATYNDDGTLDSNNETYEIVLPFQHMKFEKLTTGLQVGHLLDDKQAAYLGKPVIYYPIHSSNTGESAPQINLIASINGYDGGTSNSYETNVDAYWMPSNTPTVQSTGSGYPESIHFNQEINEWYPEAGTDYTDTLFEKYYKSYITNVFRFNERLTKIKARLPLSFLQEYSLADELQIGDLTYRINSITTNLQTGESTLELLNGSEAVVSSGVGSISITISSSNSTTPSTACGYTLNTTVYYTGLLGNTTQLFTDSALTNNYTGSGNYHAFPGSNYATIDTNGYISNYQPCPTLAPSMTTNSATNITYQSFTMNGSLDVTNGTVTQRGFYYGVSPTYTNNTKEAVSGTSTGSFSLSKSSGILANTPYYVTAYGINQHGEGVGTTVSFTTSASPNTPTVVNLAATNITSDGFRARLEITADGGATIDAAGFWMGTNNSSYNGAGNSHYAISPAPSTIGIKEYDFTGLNASTNYYYWGTASNTYSTSDGIASSFESVQTSAQITTHSPITYDSSDAWYACQSSVSNTYYSSGLNNTFGTGLVIYTNSSLTTLAPDGYYAYQNYYYQVSGGNGTLGTQQTCSTPVRRLVLSAGYPTTYYTSSSAACSSSYGTTYAYYAGALSSGRQMYTDVNLTTTFTGAGTQAYPDWLYPSNYVVKAKRQYYTGAQWLDLGSSEYVGYISTSGIWQLGYYDYDNGDLVCP